VREAAAGGPTPRRPWLEPLPAPLPLDELHRHASGLAPWELALAVADDPDHQRRQPVTWDLDRGNLFVYGMPASGTEGALTTVALALAERFGPEQVHLYVLAGHRRLAGLADLPHVAAVVAPGDVERQHRVVHRLLALLDARRSGSGAHQPRVVLLVDGLDSLLRSLDDPLGLRLADDLVRLLVDGPAGGIHALATADRPGTLPTRATARTEQRIATRLPDPYDYVSLGLRPHHATAQPPGRGVDGSTGLELQLADPVAVKAALADLTTRAPWAAPARGPASVHRLPDTTPVADLTSGSIDATRPWFVPIGLGDAALEPVGFHLHEADHAVVLGPARSGRSNLLATVATQVHRTRPNAVVVGLAPRRSPLTDLAFATCFATADHLASFVRALAPCGQPWIALVDDAELVADDHGALAAALQAGTGEGHVIAASRTDQFRPGYGHWLSTLVGPGPAVVLWPDPHDSHPWVLPPPVVSTVRRVPGRGVLLDDGLAETMQAALA
jgi:S-DNA-T family DNA segregation ATPase FtsK/SpoIIIE